MQDRHVAVEVGKGVQQLECALSGHPVADAEKGHRSSAAEVGQLGGGRCDVSAGCDHDDTFGGQAVLGDQLVGKRGAGRQQQAAAPVEPAIERRLHGAVQRPVIDATGRLVQNGSQWRPPVGASTGRRVVPPGPWRCDGCSDAVDHDDVTACLPQGVAGPARRDEVDLRVVVGGCFGHPPVVQVAAGELLG